MRIRVGDLVLLTDADRGERVHMPAARISANGDRRRRGAAVLSELRDPPLFWRTLCGLPGMLFAYDGPIRSVERFCVVCVRRT